MTDQKQVADACLEAFDKWANDFNPSVWPRGIFLRFWRSAWKARGEHEAAKVAKQPVGWLVTYIVNDKVSENKMFTNYSEAKAYQREIEENGWMDSEVFPLSIWQPKRESSARAQPDTAEVVERVAAIIRPGAFVGTPQQIHMHCSSLRVDVVQEETRDIAMEVIAYLSALPPCFDGRFDLDPAILTKACAAVREKGEETLEYAAATAIREYLRHVALPPCADSGLVGELAEALTRADEVMSNYTFGSNDEDEWNNDDVIACRELLSAVLARYKAQQAGEAV